MTIDVTTNAISIIDPNGKIAAFPIGSMIVRKISDTKIQIDSIHTNDLYNEDIDKMNLVMIKNTGIVAPGANDDNTGGYIIGDIWYDSVGEDYYQATTVGTGTATWTILTDLDAVIKDYTRKLVEHMGGTAGIF